METPDNEPQALEDLFESHVHKFNWTRKAFANKRRELHGASLIYQPGRLREVCKKYPVDTLLDAINEALGERRGNYFNAFISILGEEISEGGWDSYQG